MKNKTTGKLALVLAGCGAKDGSEITEAVSLMINLSLEKIPFDIYAPNRNQADVINHLNHEKKSETRNMMEEAARIARGKIKSLDDLNPHSYAGLVLAGGFGTVKNLCNYASQGQDAILNSDIKTIIEAFIIAKKPIAALCIAPIIVALGFKALGIKGMQLTLGDGTAKGAINDLEAFGAKHVICSREDSVVDHEHKLISAPAYMYDDATSGDIFLCAQSLVRNLKSILDIQ